ncbi:MAG: hypothetical protein M1549_03815 [Candidatus Dependentiae bacterium]|nr:hypothetical protein [Candidatus Dependentiae bacterium]
MDVSYQRGVIYLACLLVLSSPCILRSEITVRDAVNTNDNTINNYTKVVNKINLNKLVTLVAKTSVEVVTVVTTRLIAAMRQAVKNGVSNLVSSSSAAIQQGYRAAQEGLFPLLWEYRWRLVGITAASGYLYLVYRILAMHTYFQQPERWFNWYEQLSLEALCAYPQKELEKELVREVQRRYTAMYTPTDFITPLIKFLQALDEEERMVKSYLSIGSFVQTLRLSMLTRYDRKMAKQCKIWKQRLAFLRNTFMRWMADYKLEQNTIRQRLPGDRALFLRYVAQRYRASTKQP